MIMTIITKNITINGIEYGLKFPVGRIIAMERETGIKIQNINTKDISGLATIVRFAIMKDGKYMSASEFDELMDNISIEDFNSLAIAIGEILTPPKN